MSDEDIPKLVLQTCSDGEDSDEWLEDAEEEETVDLFSSKTFKSIENAIEFLKSEYSFDLCDIKAKYSMDQYSFIKVVISSLLMNDFLINIVLLLDDQFYKS